MYDPVKDDLKTAGVNVAGEVGGKKGKQIAQDVVDYADYKKVTSDLKGAIKKGDYVKTAEKGYNTVDNLVSGYEKVNPYMTGSGVGPSAHDADVCWPAVLEFILLLV